MNRRPDRVIFLDRDGVINGYPGDGNWVTSLAEFTFLPRALEAIARLSQAGHSLCVVSNQAGVEKGLFSREALSEITDHMLREVRKCGGRIEKVCYCTHTREMNCSCRKPKTGLLQQATAGLEIEPGRCTFVGDTFTDIETGKNFGCRTILVFSGKEKEENRANWPFAPDFTAADLAAAADIILAQDKK